MEVVATVSASAQSGRGQTFLRRARTFLGPFAVGLFLVSLTVSLVVVPPDAAQGQSQRLMYVHVPAAWVAYVAFLVVLAAGVAYLRSHDLRWDRLARAAAELGVGLTALTIALGSLWGRVTWGVWWTWDARLLTTAVLLVVYVGYLGLRGLWEDPRIRATRAAVLGIIAFVNVPVVHFSVVWWRTLHQPPTVLSPAPSRPIAPEMALALALGVLAFTALAVWVLDRRTSRLAALAPQPGPAPEAAARPTPIEVHRVEEGGAQT